MKTFEEWRVFLGKLDLSTRSYNLLLRAYHEPSEYELKYNGNKGFIWEALKQVETYEDLESAIKMLSGKIRNFGYTCESEVLSAIANIKDSQKIRVWHNMSEGMPKLGIPLAVKTVNTMQGNKQELKYPVYYMQHPYENRYAFWWFVDGGINELLPDCSKVGAYAEIMMLDEMGE